MTGDRVSLYFHLPFCTKKCPYCHFYVLPDREDLKSLLMEGLELEWKSQLSLLQGKKIETVYFGGGTPSLFGPKRIARLLDLVHSAVGFSTSSPEITLEANPELLSQKLMQEYAAAGINRVSLGVQSLVPEQLRLLGRSHTPARAIEAIHEIYRGGIENISIDLMYDIPDQGLPEWRKSLEKAAELPIRHLSLYNLTIEPETLFFKQAPLLKPRLPDAELSAAMYQEAIEILFRNGLKQYEISAFSREGFPSQHNSGYWTGRSFLGFGPSAFSYWEGKRFRNIPNLKKYLEFLKTGESPVDFLESLSSDAKIRELLVLHLRLLSGISLASFQEMHGPLEAETLAEIKRLITEGFLIVSHVQVPDTLSLTRKGTLFYDHVAAQLI